LAKQGTEVYIIVVPRFGKKTTSTILNIARKIPKDLDVLHIQHEYGIWQKLDETLYAELRLLGMPIVTTLHSVGSWEEDINIRSKSDQVIVHNKFCALKFNHPCEIIPHGAKIVSDMPESDVAKRAIGIPPNVPIIGYLGFISAYKGLEFLIEAVKDLPYFLLIGGGYFTTGPDTLYIQKKKEETAQKLGKRCRWIGYVADHDLAKIYAAMDVVVYPSRFHS